MRMGCNPNLTEGSHLSRLQHSWETSLAGKSPSTSSTLCLVSLCLAPLCYSSTVLGFTALGCSFTVEQCTDKAGTDLMKVQSIVYLLITGELKSKVEIQCAAQEGGDS